jgi:hypothetical protein
MDAFLTVDSRGWVTNRYDGESVSNVKTLEFSKAQRSATVYADYTFNGGQSGWVKVRVVDGELKCLEFWDFEGQCRPLGKSPSQGIAVGLAAAAMTSGDSGSDVEADSRRSGDMKAYQNYQHSLNPEYVPAMP